MSAWERVKLARHAERPHTLDYLNALMTDWVELHGDRSFGDDLALIGGLASFDGQTVMVLGHQKGNDTKENITRNFGMARPEGYRKAERLMRHAEKFGFPVITFIDTPGRRTRHRFRGARSGDGDRREPADHGRHWGTDDRRRHRRGRLGRRAGHRRRRSHSDARERHLRGRFTGSLRGDPLEGRRARRRSSRDDAHHRGRSGRVWNRRRGHPGTRPAHEQPKEAIRATGEAIARHLRELVRELSATATPTPIERLRAARYDRFRRIGAWRETVPGANGLDAAPLPPR